MSCYPNCLARDWVTGLVEPILVLILFSVEGGRTKKKKASQQQVATATATEAAASNKRARIG